jgi:integrase
MDKLLRRAKKRWVKSLGAFLYVTGCRISAAISLHKDDFVVDDVNLYVTIPYQKQAKMKKRRALFPTPAHLLTISLDTVYISDIIIPYLTKVKDGKSLWPISRVTAWKYIKRLHPKGELSPHVLRHSRLQMLSEQDGVTPQALMSFAGWTSIGTADSYIQGSAAHAAQLRNKIT